ncbi:MAG: hypothetical protein EPO23_00920 [Xanthobacteraceae bacterium]|nr:MAG: hypothetical protein EPO23_00920 [Xanthobacteraceae bacterium]
MRSVAALLCCVLLFGVSSTFAETRIFVVANQADGYGVDRCLAKGERCGLPVAMAFCQARAYTSASAFHKVDADDVTGTVPQTATPGCSSATCDDYVAITCQR